MNFSPKQHLKIGNYIQYLDDILNKCDKGIEYCKMCPNELVCSELEKDDFGLQESTISDVLTAIQYALNKIPGYLNLNKRIALRDHIRTYINESPPHEKGTWEDSILDILLDDKLANPIYKPMPKVGEVRTLLTYHSKISFSTCLKCIFSEDTTVLQDTTAILPEDIFSPVVIWINQFVHSKHINNLRIPTITHIKYFLEEGVTQIASGCNLQSAGLAAALCYYAMLTKLSVPANIVVTGGLDGQGRTIPSESLDDKIEVVLRELHFIDEILVARNSAVSIALPNTLIITEVGSFEQAIDVVRNRNISEERKGT
ncbi:MAG: hypothetical protein DCC43_06845 [Candidatus Brocadia sp.]|nr:hypothetical protein [Candidatus Brocadia sp. AMX3]RIK00663.1 MAG: hypothetical protein DCC43_06845 [Candidatus Brocadia sp.]